MAFTFDTLRYSKRLIAGGVPAEQAEAHADAAREFVMNEIVTKADLADALERQTLRLTVRLGGIMVAGIAALALLLKF